MKGIKTMGHVDGFPDKDGLRKLVTLAKAMCATVAAFSALILKKYPDNPLIASLLTAIAAVCALIPEIESEFIEDTGNNDPALEDPANLPGIDPSAPPAPELT
jgi:hypothetical protein